MEPLLFKPLLKQIRWGGRRLGTVLNKPIGNAEDYAESWEIADQPSGQSVVASGVHAGRTLHELISEFPASVLGRHAQMKQFPLLIKFLDANDWLSLQVHPDDRQAVRYNPSEPGKTEAWVILDAQPESRICCGLRQGVTASELERHLLAGTVEETLNIIPVSIGDCVFVPAQTVHALGPGILLAEVQQQSNITFRLYDWGKVGSDGKPREVHVRESLDCTDFSRGPVYPVMPETIRNQNYTYEKLVECDYFAIHRHRTASSFSLTTDNRFRILMLLEGTAVLKTNAGEVALSKGVSALIPAATTSAEVFPATEVTMLEVYHP